MAPWDRCAAQSGAEFSTRSRLRRGRVPGGCRVSLCAVHSASLQSIESVAAGRGRMEDAIREQLKKTPTMPATVIAERVGWTRGMTVFSERVRELRPVYLPPDPSGRTCYDAGDIAHGSPRASRWRSSTSITPADSNATCSPPPRNGSRLMIGVEPTGPSLPGAAERGWPGQSSRRARRSSTLCADHLTSCRHQKEHAR